ncbi:LysR family transcriptional regulator [Streptomyces sp. BI20]|uniref:LysR family transcriptional regulator n=1 Tax=Streptomyces sp. BI20 TaxID=3403460 RepID=UPI003C78284A
MAPLDLDPRLLRGFLAVAEELHFSRAAARRHVAQQALSRDVRRLEALLGTVLFARTTRQVQLTPDGERLLPLARRVLAAHEELAAAFTAPDRARPLLVDLNTEGPGTPAAVLAHARDRAPEHEFLARFERGLTHAAAEIAAGRLDCSFGRVGGLTAGARAHLAWQPVRLEPLAVLLPADHPLAAWPAVPLAALAGEDVYAGAGNPHTPEWTDLARHLFEGRGIGIAPAAPVAIGAEEFRRVMARTRTPVLVTVDFPELPGSVRRPLVEPVPHSPVSLVWRRGLRHPALSVLREAAAGLAAERGWLTRVPEGGWAPEPLTSG